MSLHAKLVQEAAKAREAGTEPAPRIDCYGNRVVNMRGFGRPASHSRELAEAEAAFAAAGGRGVELAERIDVLRARESQA